MYNVDDANYLMDTTSTFPISEEESTTLPILEEEGSISQSKSNDTYTRLIQYITSLVYSCTTSFISSYSFVSFYFFFLSALFWGTMSNFYTIPIHLAQKLKKIFKVTHTIPKLFLYRLPEIDDTSQYNDSSSASTSILWSHSSTKKHNISHHSHYYDNSLIFWYFITISSHTTY